MVLPLFKDVILTRDVVEADLSAGDVGTVVERHEVAGKEDGYSVEFFDLTGRSLAVVTLPASALRAPIMGGSPHDQDGVVTFAPLPRRAGRIPAGSANSSTAALASDWRRLVADQRFSLPS